MFNQTDQNVPRNFSVSGAATGAATVQCQEVTVEIISIASNRDDFCLFTVI